MRFVESIKRHKRHIAFIFVITIVYSFLLVYVSHAVTTGAADPGTVENPLVSQDYVDSKIGDLLTKNVALAAKITELEGKLQQTGTAGFEIVQIPAGKQVICGMNTQFIMRGGKATAIAGASGGISDLTGGTDLRQDVVIPSNHLILVPKDDGRGFNVHTDAWVLVNGQYEIK